MLLATLRAVYVMIQSRIGSVETLPASAVLGENRQKATKSEWAARVEAGCEPAAAGSLRGACGWQRADATDPGVGTEARAVTTHEIQSCQRLG